MSKDKIRPLNVAIAELPVKFTGLTLGVVNALRGPKAEQAAELLTEALKKFSEESEIVESSIVDVDRSISANYPSWVKERLYQQLEKTGPASFDVATLEHFLLPAQKTGVVTGNAIHTHLKDNNMLEGCLGLRDLEEIQKKDIAFFRKYFKGKAVFGWKDIVRSGGGNLRVPCLYEGDGKVVLDWHWLDVAWGASYPALRFA